jgi:hypothetical protein
MTSNKPPNDEETSVYTVAMPPSPPVIALPPEAQPPVVMAQPPVAEPPLYPTYVQPTYARAGYGTAARVVFAGVVLLVFGLAEALGGAAGAVIASSLRRVFDQLLRNEGLRIEAASLTSVLTAVFVTMLVLGILHIVAAGGVLAHRGWGRWLGVLLSLLGVVVGAWLVGRVFGAEVVRPASSLAPLAILVPYSISLLALLFPADHFRRGGRSR